MAMIMSGFFHWQNSSSLIHGDDYVESFDWQILPHEFIAMIMSGLFHCQNSSSWIHGDDFDVSFRLKKFVLINSWRRLCRVFFINKIRPHEFMAMIMSGLFHWQYVSSLFHGDDYVASFPVTKFVLINSWRWLCRVFFTDKIRPH